MFSSCNGGLERGVECIAAKKGEEGGLAREFGAIAVRVDEGDEAGCAAAVVVCSGSVRGLRRDSGLGEEPFCYVVDLES